MSEPAFLNGGDTPRRTDTRWFRWLRILSQYQNRAGALPENNPSRLDTIRQIKQKVLYALNGVASGFHSANLIPSIANYDSNFFYSLTGLTIGESYTVVFGTNDIQVQNFPDETTSTGPGSSDQFTANATSVILAGVTQNSPVTARIYLS